VELITPSGSTKKLSKKGEEGMLYLKIYWIFFSATPATQKKEKKISGVYVRSQSIAPIRSQTMQQKVNSILEEFGVGIEISFESILPI
jgi:hypothetical protein